MIDKGLCDKGYIWNPSNCECECDKSCDVGEYLDYENCKCRNKLADKLVKKCTENIEKVKIVEHTNKCSSCILYIVLFPIFFAVNIGIATNFICHKYMNRNRNEENVSKYGYSYTIKNYSWRINGRSQANKY